MTALQHSDNTPWKGFVETYMIAGGEVSVRGISQ